MREEWVLHTENGISYFTSPLLDSIGAKHLFSTRIGGVSQGYFSSWNFAAGTGEIRDSEECVLKNYEIAANLFGLHMDSVCRTYQAHTSNVIRVTEQERGVGTVKPKFDFGVDGLVTVLPNTLLSVRSADCVPILFYDSVGKVCGAVHSGWRGTVAGIAANAIEKMIALGSRKENILCAIGPCIEQQCYEVGPEVKNAFLNVNLMFDECFSDRGNGRFSLGLTHANELILQRAGIDESRISSANICTKCHPEYFFSHRGMGSCRGTMSAFITL